MHAESYHQRTLAAFHRGRIPSSETFHRRAGRCEIVGDLWHDRHAAKVVVNDLGPFRFVNWLMAISRHALFCLGSNCIYILRKEKYSQFTAISQSHTTNNHHDLSNRTQSYSHRRNSRPRPKHTTRKTDQSWRIRDLPCKLPLWRRVLHRDPHTAARTAATRFLHLHHLQS